MSKEKIEMFSLTERELEVLKLMTSGLSNTEIAETLFISKHTAKAHVSALMKKLNTRSRSQATFLAGKNNIF